MWRKKQISDQKDKKFSGRKKIAKQAGQYETAKFVESFKDFTIFFWEEERWDNELRP